MNRSDVRNARLGAGLGLRDLARRVGVAPSDLSAVEHGRREAWPALRARLAAELAMPEADLFAPDESDPALLAAVGALAAALDAEEA